MCENVRELIKDEWVKAVDARSDGEIGGGGGGWGGVNLETTMAIAGGPGTCTM